MSNVININCVKAQKACEKFEVWTRFNNACEHINEVLADENKPVHSLHKQRLVMASSIIAALTYIENGGDIDTVLDQMVVQKDYDSEWEEIINTVR